MITITKEDENYYKETLRFVCDEALKSYKEINRKIENNEPLDHSLEQLKLKERMQMVASILAEVHIVNATNQQALLMERTQGLLNKVD